MPSHAATARNQTSLTPLPRPQRGADQIAASLAAAGVTHAFGIPGGEVLALVDALDQAGIAFHLARHENAAGFMAEGHWHATGALPVLVATLGPGVANAINVVANAQQDRVPLIFLTGCVDEAVAESFTHQVFDHRAVLQPLVKASFRVQPGNEALVIEKAVALARQGRPGPVHIDVPISVAEATSTGGKPYAQPRRPSSVPQDLAAVKARIAAARNILVLAGLDLVNQHAGAPFRAFVEATGAAVLTTYKAKGILPDDHPALVGAVGLSPRADRIVRPLIDAADLIVLAGYDPIEMRQGWRDPWPATTGVIDIVAEVMPHGMHRADDLLEGDVGAILAALVPDRPDAPHWPQGEPAETRHAFRAAFADRPEWGPHAVFHTLGTLVPQACVATADSGAHRILLSQIWPCAQPRGLLQSTGLCTMGCALPLATGAALGSGQPVICFVGDAGLDMVLGELSTLRDLAVPVIIVVLVDHALGLIALKQRQMGLARRGVDFHASDFSAIARAMGGHGADISSRHDLAREARAALARPGFTLLACHIDAAAYSGAF